MRVILKWHAVRALAVGVAAAGAIGALFSVLIRHVQF